MGIDLIPIKEMKEDPVTSTYKLGSVEISKGEYANAEKINQIIEELRSLQTRVVKLENK